MIPGHDLRFLLIWSSMIVESIVNFDKNLNLSVGYGECQQGMAVVDDGELRTLDMQLYVTANACLELTSECVRVPVFFFIYNIYWCSSC